LNKLGCRARSQATCLTRNAWSSRESRSSAEWTCTLYQSNLSQADRTSGSNGNKVYSL